MCKLGLTMCRAMRVKPPPKGCGGWEKKRVPRFGDSGSSGCEAATLAPHVASAAESRWTVVSATGTLVVRLLCDSGTKLARAAARACADESRPVAGCIYEESPDGFRASLLLSPAVANYHRRKAAARSGTVCPASSQPDLSRDQQQCQYLD